jgi:hypothetical protein
MCVRIRSIIALSSLLAAGIVHAAESVSYYQLADANSPKLISISDGAPSEPATVDFDEEFALPVPRAKQTAARPSRAESVLVAHADAGPLEPEEPELNPPVVAKRSTAASAGNAAQRRAPAQLPSQRAATPASYNTAKYAPTASTRSTPSAAARSSQNQLPSERLWQTDGRSSPGSNYAAGYMANRGQAVRAAGTTAPEAVVPRGAINGQDGIYGDCAEGCYDDCCNGPNWSACYNCCGWFGGADYLLLRPTFSENTAYVTRSASIDEEENLTATDTVVPRDFEYSSGLRTSLGYRFCDCGGEVRFTYWYFDTCTNQASPRAPSDGSEIYIGQLETVTQIPGQRLLMNNDLRFNLFDIEYAKCLCFGGCDPCCQPWSLKYFVGVRIADIKRQDNGLLEDRDGDLARAWFINGDFTGAGPRVGLEGRRLFGEGRASLFARTNFSLLLGGWDLGETSKTPAINPGVTNNYFDSHTRMIPVAEIELGGNYQLNRCTSIGAGYMFQAWWDLGAFEQIQGNVFSSPIDDANIMGLDGLFARFEICF